MKEGKLYGAVINGIRADLPVEEIPEGRPYYSTTALLSIPGASCQAQSTLAYVDDKVFYFPIMVKTPITIDQVTIEITSAATAGEKCRFAIYAADTDWQPGARQVASAEIAIDANAVVDTALTETTLQEGRFLMALTLDGDTTLRVVYGACEFWGYNPSFGGTAGTYQLEIAKAYAVLADPGTDWDTPLYSGTAFGIYPTLLRVKTP